MTPALRRVALIAALAVSPFVLWMFLGWRSLFGWLLAVGLVAAIFISGHDSKHGDHGATEDLV